MTPKEANIINDQGLVSGRLQKRATQLISRFLKGDEPAFLHRHTQIIDSYFRESFETSLVGPRMGISENPYAIIALGGYGRGEQCIHSDIDLLFLFGKKIPGEAEELIREMIYPLWDLGLEVGYATRSMKECTRMAGKDFEILIPLLDARFVCGMSHLYTDLLARLRQGIIRKRSKKIITWLLDGNRARYVHFGDSSYLLEPNLKEGQGGLRDYHTMLWIARIEFDLKQPRDLEYHGCLSHDEFKELVESLSFIWNVRNRLHYLAGRKCDQLYFEYQEKLADTLQFKKLNGQQPVERFLGELHGRMEYIKERQQMFLYERGYLEKTKPGRKPLKKTNVSGLKVEKDMLGFESPEAILRTPGLLIDIFNERIRLKIPLSAEAKRLVREFAYLIGEDFSNSVSAVQSFEKILAARTPDFNVLDEMLSTGLLVRLVPEMGGIVNRIQYDEYHFYPVDKHLLQTVQTVKTFDTGEDTGDDPLCGNLYKELKNKALLLWATLLHDIGKSEPGGGHSEKGAEIVRAVLQRKGFEIEDVETISFLIEEHLLLAKTATRRDVYDEETAIICARRIKDVERLKMLYLLTVADAISTGPKAWNEWVSTLLRDLFLKVLSILEKGELATREAVETVERKRDAVLSSAPSQPDRQELEALLNVMSPRYLLYTPEHEMLEHFELYKDMGFDEFVWKITETADSNTRKVTICAKDRPGLFSKISGVFTLNGLDILDAQVFTWRNNIALDIFEVKPPPDQIFETEIWNRAEKHLNSALSGNLDLESALSEKVSAYRSSRRLAGERPHRVVVDNSSSSFFTIIEVFTYDFPGLLYSITNALFRCRLDIWVAKIATKVDQVVDVFYVRDFDGQKVDLPDQVEAIKSAVEAVLLDVNSSETGNR
ncbi:[protein-PII] uridylyltransferase [Thermodesulfobacteriota bacterium]